MTVYPYWIDPNRNIWTKINIPANSTITLYVTQKDGYRPNVSTIFDSSISNLIGCWHFDEGIGTKTYDYSGYGHNGTLNDNVSWAINGYYRNAIIVNDGGYVEIANSANMDQYKQLSFVCRVYATSWRTDNEYSIIYNKERCYELGIDNSGNLKWAVCNFTFWRGWIDTGITLNLNEWYTIVWVYESASSIKTYVYDSKGNLKTHTGSFGSGNAGTSDEYNLRIGNRILSNSSFNGIIDEVYMFDRALTQEEIDVIQKSICRGSGDGKLYVGKEMNHSLLVSTNKISDNLWEVVANNLSNVNLNGIQISFDGKDIVNSTSDSLYITDLYTYEIPYTLSLSPASSTTFSLVNEIPAVTFRKRLELYLTQNNDSTTDVILHIPSTMKLFWDNRGRYLVLTDKKSKILPFKISSESVNELYGIVYNLSEYKTNDVFYLYFDDGLERDTFNLVPEASKPVVNTDIRLEPKSASQGTLVRFNFTPIADFTFDNLSIYYNTQKLPYTYDDEKSQIYVRFPTVLIRSNVTLYIYPKESEKTILDTVIYDAAVDSFTVETINTLCYGDKLLINGRPYSVIQKYVQDTPKLGVYSIEEAPDIAVSYGAHNRIYTAILHITSEQELSQLVLMLQNEAVILEWDNDTFYVTPIQYNNQMIISGNEKIYRVTVSFKRLFGKRLSITGD